MAMNPEIKARWVAALRSGDYEQGGGYLNRDGELCCLGVLSELAVNDGITSRREHTVNDREVVFYGGNSELPPQEVMEWAGLDDVNPSVNYDNDGLATRDSVAELNDGSGLIPKHTFLEIADLIEDQL